MFLFSETHKRSVYHYIKKKWESKRLIQALKGRVIAFLLFSSTAFSLVYLIDLLIGTLSQNASSLNNYLCCRVQ